VQHEVFFNYKLAAAMAAVSPQRGFGRLCLKKPNED